MKMTVKDLLDLVNELLRSSVIGPSTLVKIDRGHLEAVPLHKLEHEIQFTGQPYLKLS